jgi:hypothetical protein
MSKLLQGRQKKDGSLGALIQGLNTQMSQLGTDFANAQTTDRLLGLESLTGPALAEMGRATDQMFQTLKSVMADAGFGVEGLSDSQLEAGTVIALAAGNPGAYARAAMTVRTPSAEGGTVIDLNTAMSAGLDYRVGIAAGLEAFDDRELKEMLGFSMSFNIQCARQGEFAEAFFPTVVVTPDQAGLNVEIRKPTVFNEIKHLLTGAAMDFNRKNLLDAAYDASILGSESTVIVPVVVAAGVNTNTDKFVASGDVAPYTRVVDGVDVTTAPLIVGKEINLLGLSQRDSATIGQMDNSDSLDIRIHLTKLYFRFTDAVTGGNPSSIIGIDVSRMVQNQFQKSTEGQERDLSLNFRTVDLPVTFSTLDVNGVDAVALDYLDTPPRNTWIVRLKVAVTGSANVEYGNVSVNGGPVTIDSVWSKNASTGALTRVTDSTTLTNLNTNINGAAFPITLIGYDLFATRSNLNRRTGGLQLASLAQNERHVIPLGSPLRTIAPIASNRDASDLQVLITAARMRNDNNAVTTLLNYQATLASLELSTDRSGPIPAIEGIGRLVVRPYYEAVDFDVLEHINSTKSHERAADVAAAFTNKIRDIVFRMYNETGYQVALDAATGGAGAKPVCVIGTDPVTARFLTVQGDNRLLGLEAFPHKIVTTVDTRIKNKIFITFVREGQSSADYLSFGTHGWMPELASTVQLTRSGATIKEVMVQPRQKHINNLPVLAVLNVSNLSAAVGDQIAILTDEVPVGP